MENKIEDCRHAMATSVDELLNLIIPTIYCLEFLLWDKPVSQLFYFLAKKFVFLCHLGKKNTQKA